MNSKSIGMILMGVTVVYAGILSFATSIYAGVGMAMVGGIIVLMPISKMLQKPRTSSGKPPSKRRGRPHLTIVKDQDERPTYH